MKEQEIKEWKTKQNVSYPVYFFSIKHSRNLSIYEDILLYSLVRDRSFIYYETSVLYIVKTLFHNI